jgi:hypothetical protein
VGLDSRKFATLRTPVRVKSCPSDYVGSTSGVPQIVAKLWRSASTVTPFKPPRLEPREGSLGGVLTSLEGRTDSRTAGQVACHEIGTSFQEPTFATAAAMAISSSFQGVTGSSC